MHTLLARSLVLCSMALASSQVLADDKLARPFDCVTPRLGADRCGGGDKNYRVGKGKRVSIQLDKSQDGICIKFYVRHAVSGKELATVDKLCPGNTARAWTNPEDESVDVYLQARSIGTIDRISIQGKYIFE